MRSFAAFVAVVTLPMVVAPAPPMLDRCQMQLGGHTNAICCATGTSYIAAAPGPLCDYERTLDKCQSACCGTTCALRAVVCPADYVKKAAYDRTASNAGDSAAVTLAACCERTCKSMGITCPTGKNQVEGFDTLACADQADCEADCCRPTCASAPATACTTAGLAPKAKYATILCPKGGCGEANCCERTCKSSAITCAAGTNQVEGFDTKLCASQGACEADCCKRTCASAPARECTTPGLVQRAKYATILCPNKGGCNEADCCEPTCKSKGVTCGAGYIKLAAFDTITCAGAVSTCVDTCCEKTCTHKDHATTVCAAIGSRTFQQKRESATIACSTGRTTNAQLVSKCDNELCCDLTRVARDVDTVRATLPHTLVSCVENSECRKHGDATATCDTKTNECTCTNCDAYNFKGKDTFTWENTRCYQKKSTHHVALIFAKPKEAGDICKTPTNTNPIPKDVRAAIVAVYETFSGSKVVSAEFLCSGDKVTAAFRAETDKGVSLPTDEAGYNTALAGQTTAIKNKLGGAVETLGGASAGCKMPVNVAEQLAVDGTCLVQKCDIGYYKHKESRDCTQYVAGTTAAGDEFDHCIVDADCTWRDHVGWCVEGKCVLNLDTYQAKLKKPTGTDKNWCTDDASCTSFGDVNATCSKNVGLGNWCSCAHADYDYPAGDNVGLCVPTAATTIKFGYKVMYDTGLACPTTEAQVAGFTALIRKVLGDDAAVVAHRCTGARVVFLGVGNLAKALAVELASGGSSVFVAKLVAERAVGKAGAATSVTVVATADRDADALADPYAGLGNAVPTSATVGAQLVCPKPFATSTGLYNTQCVALECLATHAVIGDDCIAITPTPNTTAPATTVPVVVATDDDSGLSNGEKAGLGIGITFGVLLIVGVIVAVVIFSKKSDEPAKAEENEPAAEPADDAAAGDVAGDTAV